MRRPRNVWIAVLVATALFTVAAGTLGYRWITSSRPVTAASAVERYRAEQASDETSATPQATHTAAPTAAAQMKARGIAPTATRTAAPGRPTAKKADAPWWVVPASGVYTYKTTGFEKATFSRNYPSETQRIINTAGGVYDNHHIFSQEHEEWFTLHPSNRGGEMNKRRMRITFGPVTVDQTVTFDPPLLGVPVPYQLGGTWSGSWKGDTSGTYTGRTIDHRTIRVGDENVEVWVNELKLQLQGKVSGSVDTKLWYAPKLGMDAREDGMYDVRSQGTPGTYHTEYTITLDSTRPQR